MRRILCATVLLALASLVAPVAMAGVPPKITHEAIPCVPVAGNARIVVGVEAASPIASARVLFRSTAREGPSYFLDLRQGAGGSYWVVLPSPLPETTAVEYRIVVKDNDGQETSTQTFTAPATAGCTVTLSAEESAYAGSLAIGLTAQQQSGIPFGFSCRGLSNKITTGGELWPNEECRALLAAGGGAGAPILIAGAAPTRGSKALISRSGGSGGSPVSDARPRKLPKTASEMPILAILGVLFLAAGTLRAAQRFRRA
jgi:LPXTG-motif cell wall-anchored protein